MNLLTVLQKEPFIHIEKRLEEIDCDFSLLDESERERYDRFLHPTKKEEFLAARCLIKQELGEVYGKTPKSISLSITENGKPYHKQEGVEQVHFNLSHGGGYFVLALSLNLIGVDLEKKREVNFEVMQPILSEAESHQLAEIPEAERSNQILNLFTAKEAFIKATDKAYGLDKISFTLENDSWKLSSPDHQCSIEHVNHDELIIAVAIDRE